MTQFIPGQGVLGKIPFVDGTVPEYDRTYLIISVENDYIEVLNVSSIKGKERKLAFPANVQISPYCPPFLKPSFVKLDSLTKVSASEYTNLHILSGGKSLDNAELLRIIALLQYD